MSQTTIVSISTKTGTAKVYSSARAASRELSGDGSDRRRSQILNLARQGKTLGNVILGTVAR